MTDTTAVMPDFISPTAGFAHSVDSALLALEQLGVPDARIALLMDGPGRPGLAVVKQSPPPGSLLASTTRVTLSIAGFGFFHALPLPMRESGADREMGTRELCRIVDSPVEKMARWFRAGAPMFAFSEQRPDACRRWLALFGMDASLWPEEMWFRLSLLMPALSRLGGREGGIRLTMRLLFDIPLHSVESFTTYRKYEQASKLGERSSRLGVDWIAGNGMWDVDGIRLRLGPVSLTQYTQFQSENGRELLKMACDLCLSAYQDYSIAWLVEDKNVAPVLGNDAKNGRLGVNFHLGRGIAS
ncbi:type VI secretion system baseplate subunit TssG [Silvibacterium acidisoli]|uniref:type VI secretion system baseplate subunit TssG n=1 Tax=Acidobacteriaceae bacterium ZG23-2 TaxID=2883246 RepID=UPI00406D2A87